MFFLDFVFFSLFWFFLGSGEVAQRATSLGPKPSLIFCFVFLCLFVFLFWFLCVFCFLFLIWFGGFKGQVRWPKRVSRCYFVFDFLLVVLFCFESQS